MKIATWNVNSLRVRIGHVTEWLTEHNPDVLCLQETKVEDKDFPTEEFKKVGYRVIFSGQKTYNGVAIAYKDQASDIIQQLPEFDSQQRRLLAATIAGIRVINVYIPNGSEVGSDKYQFKLDWLVCLEQFIKKELMANQHLVLLGDFNIAPEDNDVHDPSVWRGSILVSDKERAAFQQLIGLGLVDIFRQFDQEQKCYSWWDYRAAAFRRDRGLRIDLILASTDLAQRCRGSSIDKSPRRRERPSDHTPVVAEFSV